MLMSMQPVWKLISETVYWLRFGARDLCCRGFDGVFFVLLYTFWYRPLPVGIKHHRPYKINQFSAHDSPPKWCGCSPRPGAQCGNDPQVKGRLASSSIKEKDCNCTMHRFCVRTGASSDQFIYWYMGRKLSSQNDTKCFQNCKCCMLYILNIIRAKCSVIF